MNTHRLIVASPAPAPGAAPLLPRIADRIGALAAAFAEWRRRRAAAAAALRASPELTGLSEHVLRDIGARDGAAARAAEFADCLAVARVSALDFEIRG